MLTQIGKYVCLSHIFIVDMACLTNFWRRSNLAYTYHWAYRIRFCSWTMDGIDVFSQENNGLNNGYTGRSNERLYGTHVYKSVVNPNKNVREVVSQWN